MESIAKSALLKNYEIGGALLVAQATYGVQLAGDRSADEVYPRDAP